jgi:predicted acylesterase/phospholipase RssA
MAIIETSAGSSVCRILSLDGGGAKGFYTLGVLEEIEGLLGRPLHESFDLVFGTSTGAIIAALIALGYRIEDIHRLYREHVPTVVGAKLAGLRTRALRRLSRNIFSDHSFEDVKTGIGIVATKWLLERPMIFKGRIAQAHGRKGTFVPGFGVSIADAVEASCSAYPFFKRKTVHTSDGDDVELIDGGYCANNPTLYAIADATVALGCAPSALRVISIGVGNYPEPRWPVLRWLAKRYIVSIRLLQKTLETNTQSMDQLRTILFPHVQTVRISDTFEQPEMATDLLEKNLRKLNLLRQRGRQSFASKERDLKAFLL